MLPVTVPSALTPTVQGAGAPTPLKTRNQDGGFLVLGLRALKTSAFWGARAACLLLPPAQRDGETLTQLALPSGGPSLTGAGDV